MTRVQTVKEEMERRKIEFAQLQPDSLFDLGIRRWFIAVQKLNDSEWIVIELTPDSLKKITKGQTCDRIILNIEDMFCLNVR